MSFKFSSPKTLLDRALRLDYFTPDEQGETAIPYHRVDGQGKLIVVVGDNASGKSFLRRIVQLLCQKNKIECIHLSMEGRRNIGMAPWLTFVYGDEGREATGVNSAGTIITGITTCQGREGKHVIFWDEPDIGLSDDWAAGSGQRICKFTQDSPKHTLAAIVVSHSRALVRELLPAKPFYLHLGVESEQAPPTLDAWLERPIVPRDPEELRGLSRKRFKAIQAILNTVKP